LGVLAAFSTAEPARPITDHRLAFSMAEPARTDGRTDFYCRTGPDGQTDGQISMAELARTDGRTDGRNFYLFSFFANFISTNKIFLRMIQYFPSQNFALCPSVRNFYLFN
jgi:hypothetical protein